MINILYDPTAIMNVLGCLVQNCDLLAMTDKYKIELDDFDDRFTKAIFIGINNLYKNGANKAGVLEVSAYLSQNPGIAAIFKENNGEEYLSDAQTIASLDNFHYYYTRMKKFSALRKLANSGYDIKRIFDDNITDPRKARESMIKFDNMSIKDIFDEMISDFVKIEADFVGSMSGASGEISEGMEELLEELRQTPEIGFSLQGEIFNTIIRGARKRKLYLRSGATGSGKALPNSTRIPTPNGWTTVENIRVGDYLFDGFGKPTKVLGVFPQGKKDVYEITFKDGRKARCCKDHLWSFNTHTQKAKSKHSRNFYTETLEEIIEKRKIIGSRGFNIMVPLNKAVNYPEKEFPIDPYILGLFLGDGSFRQGESNKALCFSSSDQELIHHIELITGWAAKKNQGENFSWTFDISDYPKNNRERKNIWVEEFLQTFPSLIGAYSENKFIPEEYLFGSIEQRFSLLQGLMDTDGSIDSKGRISFSTISSKLKDNLVELCQSLGMIATVGEDNRIDKYKKTGVCYNVHIQTSLETKQKLFRLSRKLERVKNEILKEKRREDKDHNPIVNINKLDYTEEMTCFYVDNEEHLFLMNDYIVTHNTRLMIGDACNLAYPTRYNPTLKKWINTGSNQKVLFVTTENEVSELQTIVWAYLSGVNEEKILFNMYEDDEEERVKKAKDICKKFQGAFFWEHIPDPTIDTVSARIKKQVRSNKIDHVFYDYIFSSPSLIREFEGFGLREDVVLLMLATKLKDLANELNVFIMTGTQLNGGWEDAPKSGIRNQNMIRG